MMNKTESLFSQFRKLCAKRSIRIATLLICLQSGLLGGCGGGASATPATPEMTIDNNVIVEGNTGSRPLFFVVNLSAVVASTVTVDYATNDGSAQAGTDYQATSGTLVINPGVTTASIAVTVFGDIDPEADQSFSLELSSPSANIRLAATQATGTILDDDSAPLLPELSIADSSIAEGDSGVTDMTFVVGLSATASADVTFDYATTDGTAIAATDYLATSGSLTIPAGEVSGVITVSILGDTAVEPDRFLDLTLTNLSANATFADASAVGNIIDDDSTPPAAGSLDLTFASLGYRFLDLDAGADDKAYAAAIQPDGHILLAGGHVNDIALLRLDANGNIDTGFGTADRAASSLTCQACRSPTQSTCSRSMTRSWLPAAPSIL